jgi:hypothetical protein
MASHTARPCAQRQMARWEFLVLALTAMASGPVGAAAYGTAGTMYVGTTDGYNNPVFPEVPAVLLAESTQTTHSAGHSMADASIWASLASAQLVTHAAATAKPADAYGAGAAAMVEPVSFKDRLSFLIPASGYANDLRLRLSGFAAGSLQAEGCQNGVPNSCSNGYQIISFHIGGSYGGQDYSRRLDVDAGGASSQLLGDRFTLDIRLLPAGAFENDVTVDVAVEAYMISRGMALNTYSYPFGASKTLFAADFGAAFTDLEVTGAMAAGPRSGSGITWTSASGVFLSQPVPEPDTWALMLMGGLVTVAAVRRRQQP